MKVLDRDIFALTAIFKQSITNKLINVWHVYNKILNNRPIFSDERKQQNVGNKLRMRRTFKINPKSRKICTNYHLFLTKNK